jgi:hypothetical protein
MIMTLLSRVGVVCLLAYYAAEFVILKAYYALQGKNYTWNAARGFFIEDASKKVTQTEKQKNSLERAVMKEQGTFFQDQEKQRSAETTRAI